MQTHAVPAPIAATTTGLRALSLDEHARLERLFEDVLDAYRLGPSDEVAARWTALDAALCAHMDLEEREVLPAFAAAHPDEARALRREHETIRQALLDLGVCVDLHVLTPELAGGFIARLRAHALREDALLYRWAREATPVKREA